MCTAAAASCTENIRPLSGVFCNRPDQIEIVFRSIIEQRLSVDAATMKANELAGGTRNEPACGAARYVVGRIENVRTFSVAGHRLRIKKVVAIAYLDHRTRQIVHIAPLIQYAIEVLKAEHPTHDHSI